MKRTIERIVNYAVQVTDADEVILFGSMVSNISNVNSDVDLLVISESNISKKEAVEKIRNHANQYSLKTDVLIFTAKELEKELSTLESFVRAIHKSGKIVYKKS